MTVGDLTEQELIARIRSRLLPQPGWMLVGIGDDAAVVETVRNQVEVLTVDAIVEGVHFDRRFTPPSAIGYRALAVNLSDLAAMGAMPRTALLSLALPSDLPADDFDALIDGFTALAAQHQVHVAGGNVTRSPGPLMVDVTAIGWVKRRMILKRSGAVPGDAVYVTGTIGAAAAGLQMLRVDTRAADACPSCVDRYLRPQPRVRFGVLLGRNRAATACMDLSDGLAAGVRQIAEASGIGILLDEPAIPVEPDARSWFASQGGDPILEAVGGGDDYELIFTASPRSRGRLREVLRHGGVPVTRIGTCTEERKVVLTRRIGERLEERPLPRGFGHFR